MDILKIFGRQKITKKYALAILYPNKIVIDTLDKVKAGFNTVSANPTILNTDSENQLLGRTVREHLELTKHNLNNPSQAELKVEQENFLKAYGFKTLKSYHANAKYLSITEQDQEIIIEPTKNGGSTGKERGFSYGLGKSISIEKNIKDEELGKLIKETWQKCI